MRSCTGARAAARYRGELSYYSTQKSCHKRLCPTRRIRSAGFRLFLGSVELIIASRLVDLISVYCSRSYNIELNVCLARCLVKGAWIIGGWRWSGVGNYIDRAELWGKCGLRTVIGVVAPERSDTVRVFGEMRWEIVSGQFRGYIGRLRHQFGHRINR